MLHQRTNHETALILPLLEFIPEYPRPAQKIPAGGKVLLSENCLMSYLSLPVDISRLISDDIELFCPKCSIFTLKIQLHQARQSGGVGKCQFRDHNLLYE